MAEKKARESAYTAKVALGEVQLRKRKRRNDAGVRRGKRAHKDDDEDGDSNDEEPSRTPKSQEIINDTDSDAE